MYYNISASAAGTRDVNHGLTPHKSASRPLCPHFAIKRHGAKHDLVREPHGGRDRRRVAENLVRASKKMKEAGVVVQLVGRLPSIHKALCFIPKHSIKPDMGM